MSSVQFAYKYMRLLHLSYMCTCLHSTLTQWCPRTPRLRHYACNFQSTYTQFQKYSPRSEKLKPLRRGLQPSFANSNSKQRIFSKSNSFRHGTWPCSTILYTPRSLFPRDVEYVKTSTPNRHHVCGQSHAFLIEIICKRFSKDIQIVVANENHILAYFLN